MKVIVGRKNTTNIGDFSNIQPNTQLEINDVRTEDFIEVFNLAKEIVSAMDAIQTKESLEVSSALVGVKHTIKMYTKILEENIETIEETLKENINKLNELGYSI